MKQVLIWMVAVIGLVFTTAAMAAPLKLKPASPQPGGLKSGLSVRYAYAGPPPSEIDHIDVAKSMLGSAKRGAPLRGLDYRDTKEGNPVLTFKETYNVAADIRGYIRFDAPGIYTIETWSNDGIDARIGGQRVGYFAVRQGCQGNNQIEVEVPSAGWYDLRISYFQKYGTACLMMKWGKKGRGLKWVPNSVFGYK